MRGNEPYLFPFKCSTNLEIDRAVQNSKLSAVLLIKQDWKMWFGQVTIGDF